MVGMRQCSSFGRLEEFGNGEVVQDGFTFPPPLFFFLFSFLSFCFLIWSPLVSDAATLVRFGKAVHDNECSVEANTVGATMRDD